MDSQTCPIRILLVDDHALFLAAVRSLIKDDRGLTIVGEATNRAEALRRAEQRPDLILLDLDLGGEFGLDFLPELLQISENSRILVMTGLPNPELDLRAVLQQQPNKKGNAQRPRKDLVDSSPVGPRDCRSLKSKRVESTRS